MSTQQDTVKHMSFEEMKLAENNKPYCKKNSNLVSKYTKKSKTWSIRSLLFCCEQVDQDDEPTPHRSGKKSTSMALTSHYSHADPSSFISGGKGNRILLNSNTSFYPVESLFLLGKGTKKIMCKIVRKNLVKKPVLQGDLKTSQYSNDSSQKSTTSDFGEIVVETGDTYNFTRQEIFTLYSRGVQVDKSDWSEITPECISEHIATTLSGKFIIDALSGYGGNVIQFAKHCPHVIGIEIESHKIKKADHNARIYGVNHLIDLIHADYFTLRNLKADVVFLAPSEVPLEKGEKFSILKHLTPSLPKLIRHSLTVAGSLCILLPVNTDIEEIAAVFNDIYDENPEKYNKLNYSVQIDMLHLDDNLVSVVVFFGNDSMITADERRDLLLDSIELNETYSWRNCYSEVFVSRIFKHVGYHRSLRIILEIEEEFFKANIYDDSVFDKFLERIEEGKLITKELLLQMFQSDQEIGGQSVKGSLLPTPLTLHHGDRGAINGQPESVHGSVYNSPIKRMASVVNGYSNYNTLKLEGMREIPESVVYSNYLSPEHHQGTLISPTRIEEVEFKDMNATSFQSSDMAVSHYSMKSGALIDSFSEGGEGEYMLSVEDDETNTGKESMMNRRHSNSFLKIERPQKKDRVSVVF